VAKEKGEMEATSEEVDAIKALMSSKNEVVLLTHNMINRELCGEIEKLEEGYAELVLQTAREMLADDVGLIHGGFIFSAADFVAMAVVNEPNVVLVASNAQFLSPVKLGDTVRFTAKLRHRDGRKRNVLVRAFVHDIKVFEGEFKTVITEKHILKLKLAKDMQEESLA